ncbi:MAG TPA: thioredoxin [Acidimicrobiia bacterium]|jgi:putative thioredoxin|nr:thioredoxin [Acidimicrobiia bacterium]
MQHVKDVDQAGFSVDVEERSRQVPVVVDFWAEWCTPCKVLSPALERAVEDQEGAVELAKVDVDANQQLAMRFGVQGIPTVVAFRNGEPVSRFTGALPEQAVRQWVEQLLPSDVDRAVDLARQMALDGDSAEAEAVLRTALQTEPSHIEAGTALASILIADSRPAEAEDVLARLSPTPEVTQLAAVARLQAGGTEDIESLVDKAREPGASEEVRLEAGRGLAAVGRTADALELLLSVVEEKGETAEEARQSMLDLFNVLGGDHPLTADYRKRLAAALF